MSDRISEQFEEAKRRLTIGEIWERLALGGTPPKRGTGLCKSPLREERHPSFSIFANGTAFKDFGSGEQGDAVEFLRLATGLEGRALFDRFRELAGLPRDTDAKPAQWTPRPKLPSSRPPEPEKLADRKTMRVPSPEELRAIARTRRLSLPGVALAVKRGYLRCGDIRRWPGDDPFHCWILCEPNSRSAAARRMDGQEFPRRDGSSYKSHALTGKAWPLGIFALSPEPPPGAAVLLLEGEGDFLAAHHFIAQWGERDVYPVALLGKGQDIKPEAAALLSGWRVRVFPHTDGWASAEKWANQIPRPGAIDAFSFDGLRMENGEPVKDLNDCTRICEADAPALEELNPLPFRPHLDPARLEFDRANDLRAALWGRAAGVTPEGFPVLDDGTVCPF